ncbi:MAG: ATP-binding cassette domain-containing protein [Actinomycetaceae bacterium]|nr:ATP-binding cassette domain-containing protein [Actinomycetaceae bacterium]MDY6082934.1 ATP-binding cassette domain-containing protein [Actinomycetaceae bacterium]
MESQSSHHVSGETRLDHVSFRHGKTPVFDDFSASFGSGIHGLRGPNGAGKSTLLRLLATELTPQQGSVTVAGVEVNSFTDALKVRPSIGYMPQGFAHVGQMTVFELVAYVAQLRGIPSQRRATSRS